jgi:HupH hydrogenase expression protein, C-terminal conserved region
MHPDPAAQPDYSTGMAQSLFSEIADRLSEFAASGEKSAIDLRSLPLTPTDLKELESLLGRGEVLAELNVAGKSEIWETGYSGVWWVRHYGDGGKIASQSIEITACPKILAADADDIAAAAARMADVPAENASGETDHVQ